MTQKSLADMKANVTNLELDLKTAKRSSDSSDRYVDLMEEFLKEAQSQYETLEFMFKKMTEAYKDLADYFVFDPVKYPLGEFFTDLRTFATQFQQCVEDNRRARETEEKVRRAEEERAAREKEREARKTQKERLMMQSAGPAASKGPASTAEMADTGVMDNLYASLSTLLFSLLFIYFFISCLFLDWRRCKVDGCLRLDHLVACLVVVAGDQ